MFVTRSQVTEINICGFPKRSRGNRTRRRICTRIGQVECITFKRSVLFFFCSTTTSDLFSSVISQFCKFYLCTKFQFALRILSPSFFMLGRRKKSTTFLGFLVRFVSAFYSKLFIFVLLLMLLIFSFLFSHYFSVFSKIKWR